MKITRLEIIIIGLVLILIGSLNYLLPQVFSPEYFLKIFLVGLGFTMMGIVNYFLSKE